MYEVLPRGASPRCAPPAKRRSARKAGPRIGGQGRPAPRHRRTKKSIAAAWRTRQTRAAKRRSCPGSATCVLYLTFYTLSSPFFWFYFPRFPRPSPSLYGFPLPFCGFFRLVFPSPLCRAAARARRRAAKRVRRSGRGAPAGRRRKDGTAPARPFPDKSRAAARTGCRLVLYPLYSEAVPRCAARRALPRPICLAPRQRRARTTFLRKPGKNRGGAERAAQSGTRGAGTTRRRAAETPSPPLLPQSAGAQTRRAGAYT